MSRLRETVQALEVAYVAGWTGATTQFENKKFDQPESSEWVHFQVLFGDSQNIKNCGGDMTYRQAGTAQLYINVPENKGSQKAYEIGDQFRTLFANKTIGNIQLRSGFIAIPTKTSNWYETRVSIPFEYDTK